MRVLRLCLIILILVGCDSRTTLAPVVEGSWRASKNYHGMHVVQRGQTLYDIAFRYDIDYRKLAVLNHLSSPYKLKEGQVLTINSQVFRPIGHIRQPIKKVTTARTIYGSRGVSHLMPTFSTAHWIWPVHGRVVTKFSPQFGKKGIDIAGRKGERVRAASGGVVAYSGNGLSGYGNLIIIKHNNQYLTAYGNNSRNLVKEGQNVKAGQIIAEIGLIERRFFGVHFEIRKTGKPVNPLRYLRF